MCFRDVCMYVHMIRGARVVHVPAILVVRDSFVKSALSFHLYMGSGLAQWVPLSTELVHRT